MEVFNILIYLPNGKFKFVSHDQDFFLVRSFDLCRMSKLGIFDIKL
jgi:hypothetical protein